MDLFAFNSTPSHTTAMNSQALVKSYAIPSARGEQRPHSPQRPLLLSADDRFTRRNQPEAVRFGKKEEEEQGWFGRFMDRILGPELSHDRIAELRDHTPEGDITRLPGSIFQP